MVQGAGCRVQGVGVVRVKQHSWIKAAASVTRQALPRIASGLERSGSVGTLDARVLRCCVAS
jgi:hypothetical protein